MKAQPTRITVSALLFRFLIHHSIAFGTHFLFDVALTAAVAAGALPRIIKPVYELFRRNFGMDPVCVLDFLFFHELFLL